MLHQHEHSLVVVEESIDDIATPTLQREYLPVEQ
jgi:hypothetical protein